MKKTIVWTLVTILSLLTIAVGGGSFYMLDYSLAPSPHRTTDDASYKRLFRRYPETRQWVDSLRAADALRDTFMTMDGGHRCHAYYISTGSCKTALVIHGWREKAISMFFLARMYEHDLGYNVIVPDLYASGQSDGEAIRMGWLDRLDMMQWLQVFKTDTMVVHGVSMGGATTMMLSGMKMPDGIDDIRFIDDCGYTSVWDEFEGELKAQFGLPAFPLLYTSSVLCRLRYGWSFGQASALSEVAKCPYPMLFIHGDSDTFVPTAMVHRLYNAKPAPKTLWIAKDTEHALAYKNHRQEYVSRVRKFITEGSN